MDRVRTHAAANAKTKAMLGRLLTDENYVELIKLESVQEIMDYLRNRTHYHGALEGSDDEHLDQIERRIERYFFESYEKLYHFYINEYRAFFKALLFRYEVENIKLYLRMLSRNETIEDINQHLIFSSLYANVNYEELAKATTFYEFIEGLKETLYYKHLKPFLEEDSARMIFHMEMILDKLYFDRLYIAMTELGKRDKELMLELLGINIDILNIQWLYRGRQYFDISPEELFNFTLIHGRRYDEKILKDLCYMPIEEFRALVTSGDYKDVFQDREYMMERAMERHMLYILNNYIKRSELSIALPVVLLFKFEYEIRDLFTIIEGVNYHYEGIRELLIREFGGSSHGN